VTTNGDAGGRAVDLEAEYNNRAKVPKAAEILAGWARDAAAFRASHPHAEYDLSYGPGERQALDLFWPGPSGDAPLAIFVHGGYWQALDRKVFSHLARGLLGHGVAVAMPSYELCPAVTLAVLVEQVRNAAAFLALRHQRTMLATGHSAGGHLAAMLLATDWAFTRGLPRGTVKAALPISGLFDLPPLTHTSVKDALRLTEAEARRLSPLFLPPPNLPLHAIVGGTEGVEYTRQTRSIAEAWDGTWEAVPGANHFTIVAPLADPKSTLVATAVGLLSG
jgi:arylformamidase